MATEIFVFLLVLFGVQQNLVAGLQNVTRRQTPDLDQLYQTLDNLNNIYSTQEDKLNQLIQQKDLFFHVIFEHSSEYDNRHYVASKIWANHIEVGEGLCEIFGGYLVEINDAQEHEFIKSFVDGLNDDAVLTGMIRNHQNEWKYMNSGETVTYFDWATPEPTEDDLRCATIVKGLNWGMFGYPCVVPNSGEHVLCEVPNQ